MTHDRHVDMAAIDWVIRQRDPAFADWGAFSDWLAASPVHATAYHEATALEADVAGLASVTPQVKIPNNVVALPRRTGLRWLFAGAVAASLVGLLSYNTLLRAPDTYRVTTALGENRTIKLDDGSRITLNGGTTMVLNHDEPRQATLERGQALFTVIHREEAPFRVKVGEAELVDIGTIFDVTHGDGQTKVAVSEGAVAYNPKSDNVRVDAGRQLVVREDSRQADVTRIDTAAVGSWTNGQLVYNGAPLAQVAAEVGRTTGIRIRTSADASAIVFRGVVQTRMPEERLVSDLAALSGTHAGRDDKGWTLRK
jgi:transmembrane sensor